MARGTRTDGHSRELCALVADARAFHGAGRPLPDPGRARGTGAEAGGTAFSVFLSWWARHRALGEPGS
jgi:hypothetical protein